ncbi:MAG: hypothetical protein P1U57_03735 [Oleibacter sp.]|nr:hypothetical protein [Thalassolituus sp.]
MSFLTRIMLVSLVAVTSACSLIYAPAGWVVYDLTDRHVTPYTMTTDDLGVACSMTQSLQPLIMAFDRVISAPDNAGIVMGIMAGGCAASEAADEGLTYLREFRAQNIDSAKDARIREKRMYAVAANRLYNSYLHMVNEYGEPGEKCPSLNYEEGVYWALGNVAGLQAVLADLKSQSVVEVPKDIAMKTVRGMQCLDNQDYWGLPLAAKAGLWILMPDSAPEGTDPWVELAAASRASADSGVRLAQAIEVIIADSAGHTDKVKDAIRRHAASLKTDASDREYRLLDVVASEQIRAVSDRMWTEATGSRTPVGEFGTFWDDQAIQSGPVLDIDDLLED